MLVCPPSHPLAKHRQVSIKKLEGQPFVGYERDIPTRRETDRLLRRYGVEVRYVMELDNIETIKRVVEIGTGLAILPEPAVHPEVKSRTLVSVNFSDETFLRPLGIVYRQGKHFSPAAEKFIEYLRAEHQVLKEAWTHPSPFPTMTSYLSKTSFFVPVFPSR